MSNERGGRRIKIVVSEYAYPHSDSAKTNGVGQVFPVIDTGFVRPTNAIEDLISKGFDKALFDELIISRAVFRYRFDKINKNLTHQENKSKQ